MIKDVTFFETTKELEKLTGLSHTELWDNGFNLDDMDWGFVLNENYMIKDYDEYNDIYYRVNNKVPDYIQQILSWMQNYCIGYCYTEHNGKHYYTLHHA